MLPWQKYIKSKGINLGIDRFGESAPYKDLYNHFNLSEEKIVNFIQKIKRINKLMDKINFFLVISMLKIKK